MEKNAEYVTSIIWFAFLTTNCPNWACIQTYFPKHKFRQYHKFFESSSIFTTMIDHLNTIILYSSRNRHRITTNIKPSSTTSFQINLYSYAFLLPFIILYIHSSYMSHMIQESDAFNLEKKIIKHIFPFFLQNKLFFFCYILFSSFLFYHIF